MAENPEVLLFYLLGWMIVSFLWPLVLIGGVYVQVKCAEDFVEEQIE